MGLSFLERDLEDIIFNADKEELRKRGLWLSGKFYRQLKIGNYGIADLVGFNTEYDLDYELIGRGNSEKEYICYEHSYKKLCVTVYELKKDEINYSTLEQATRYCKGIERYISNHRNSKIILNFYIVLIGRTVQLNNSFVYSADVLDNVSMYTYTYDIDGIRFHRVCDYKMINEGF